MSENQNRLRGKNPYRKSGVDVEKGDALVDWLIESDATRAGKTHQFGTVVSGIGGFAALFKPDFKKMEEPLLISCTDGVGTKVLLGIEQNQLEGLGIDLVAMSANDLYTLGGHPLFFLDYYATGQLDSGQFTRILTGIRQGLAQCQAALLGGETAEMPGMYSKGHFDLAGFMVGVIDRKNLLGPDKIKKRAKLYALKSSGFHSNGYSLIRRWLKDNPKAHFESLLTDILRPTKIYSEIPSLIERLGNDAVLAAAHITGGGISGNLSRVIPDGFQCRIERKLIPTPSWMEEFIKSNGASLEDVESTFNLGIGMILVISNSRSVSFEKTAKELDLEAVLIGEVVKSNESEKVVYT